MAKRIDRSDETPETLATPEALAPTAPEPKVIDGLYQAKGGGYDLHVEADSRDLAVELVKAYTGLEAQGFVLTQCKARPPHGTPILRGGYAEDVVSKENRLRYERG